MISSIISSDSYENLGAKGIIIEVSFSLGILIGGSFFISTLILALILKKIKTIQV